VRRAPRIDAATWLKLGARRLLCRARPGFPEGFPVAEFTKYLKKTASRVVAVQLDLVTDGLIYQKWGGNTDL